MDTTTMVRGLETENRYGLSDSESVPFLGLRHQDNCDDCRVETSTCSEWTSTHTPDRSQADHSRPDCFISTRTEVGFVVSICLSQVFDEYLTSGFFAPMPLLKQRFQLSDTSLTWPATITPLVISAFLLPFGRLADMYGGFPVYVGGMTWAFAWTLLAGYTADPVVFIICRAMQGFGAAAHLPAGLAMLGKLYHIGPRKNMVFSVYGAMAPFGSFVGIFAASVASRYNCWPVFFYVGAGIALLTLVAIVLSGPVTGSNRGDNAIHMDWAGSIGLATSLVLFVYSITEAAEVEQKWLAPHVVVTGALAMTGFAATTFLEWKFVSQPLLPASVFRVRYMCLLLLGLFLSYGAISVYTYYATLQ
jgi:MFS family permease